jgi:hypothetical protein
MRRVSVTLAAAALLGCKRPAAPPPTDLGQWIWTAEDSARFVESSRTFPRLAATVWIGTIRANGAGEVQSRLALSPRMAGRPRVGVVVRFDDTFTNAWSAASDSAISDAVGAALGAMLNAAEGSGVAVTEVQLDYDCPERLLKRWSDVVADVALDPLAGKSVWVTSLVAHMRHREYGDLFRDHVAGHILQVFDTGDRMSLPYVRQIERLAARQRMPFRLGIAAFERRYANGRTTNHQGWFEAPRAMRGSRWLRGIWIFPGGASWAHLLEAEGTK